MTSPTGRDLGTATGSIIIRVDSLKQAATVAQTVAKEINAAFASISGGALGNLAKIMQAQAQSASAASAIRVAEVRKEAQEVKSAADIEVAASKARAQADSDATKVLLANQKARQGGGAGRIGVGAGQGAGRGGGTAGQDYRFPTFIQFAAYPAGQLLSLAGAQGASAGVMGAGALAGLIDQMPIFGLQVRELGTRLRGLGGVFGALATGAANLAAPLGATGAGLASMLAVAAPIVLVIGGLAAVLGSVAAAFAEARKNAADYINKQLEVNQLIARGGTQEDVQKRIDDAVATQVETGRTIKQLQPLRDLLQGLTPIEMQAVQGAAAGYGGSQQYLNATANIPGSNLQVTTQMIREMSGGKFTNLAAFYAEWERLQQEFVTASEDIQTFGAALGDADVAQNSLNAAFNLTTQAAIDEAQQRREIARMSTDQLQRRLAESQADAAVLEREMSSAQRANAVLDESFQKRLDGLRNEQAAIQAMLAFGAPLRDLIEFLGKAADLAADFNRQAERTREDRAIAASDDLFDRMTEQAREVEDFVRQRGQAVEDFNRDQSRADEDYLRARQKTRDDYNEAEMDAEAEHQDRLAKIIRDARISILEAASRLDARAVFEQQRRRNQAIEDENETATEAREQRLEQFEEALADQEDQYQRQRVLRIEDFDRQLQREDQERAIRAARAEQDDALQQYRQARNYALQDARRLEDYQRQINQLASHYSVMQRIQDAGLALLRFSFNYFFGQVASDMTGIGRGGRALPTMDGGGRGVAGQEVWIGRGAQPELFIPSTNGTFLPNADRLGTTVNIESIVLGDIGSYTPEGVRAMIRDGLDEGLRQFFSAGIQRGGR